MSLSLGTFDGVHLGHQALFRRMRQLASRQFIATFSQPPVCTLFPNKPFSGLISDPAVKLALLRAQGIEPLPLTFTLEMALIPYDCFLDSLYAQQSFTHLVLGEGALFGYGRRGTPEAVRGWAEPRGIQVEYISKLPEVSSSDIRAHIAAKRFSDVRRLLGRPYALSLPIHPALCLPPPGIYRVASVDGQEGTLQISPDRSIICSLRAYKGINMSFGSRQSPVIETIEDGGSIEEIQPSSSTNQSRELLRGPNGIFIPLRALTAQSLEFLDDN